MQLFINLIEALDSTTKTNKKVEALVDFFRYSDDKDKIWALALLSGRRPKRTVNTTLLRTWAAELANIPLWLFEESYHVVGDLAETISLLVSKPINQNTQPLAFWMKSIIDLESKSEETKKRFIANAWSELDYLHCFIFNKIITGGLRIGVSDKLVIKAMAKVHNLEENAVAHRLLGNWLPQNTDFQLLLNAINTDFDTSKPYPFFLAYPIENNLETLGETSLWQAEWKWDGIRGQIIKRKGELFVWSRGEELITDKFPEFKSLATSLPNGVVLDGEIICWQNDKPLPFQILQTRIGRKNISAKILKDAPVILLTYDIIEFQGVDLRNTPLSKRRIILEKLVAEIDSSLLLLSPIVAFETWAELTEIRTQARAKLSEGLMLKNRNSIYDTGRKRGSWWKWKIAPYTIDAVMIYAQKGHGRRADLYTDYTFAVWNDSQLVPIAKAYSGLTDKELVAIDTFIKKNTTEKFGPVRSVIPELVFELAFEGIGISSRHKSGIAVRFPRILRWRHDKKASDASSLAELKALITTL